MILQALAKYYERMEQEEILDLEPEGFKRVAIPFVIVLRKDGSVAGIDDTRKAEGKRKLSRQYIVPKVFEGSRTVNVKANLLWDKASYVFGVSPKGRPERLKVQRDKFLSTIVDYFPNQDVDEGVKAVINFLKHHDESIKNYREWEEINTKDPFLAFRLEGEPWLICNRHAVKEAIANKIITAERGICLVTGKIADLARLENPIKGLRGSGKGESHLVSFNESAYWSYGKEGKNLRYKNAPISKSASAAYVTAINYMQRDNSRQWLKIGDATTLFWAERKHEIEKVLADIFGEPPKDNPDQDYKALIAMFKSPESGAKPELDPNTKFYVLGLAPNAARIAVRFWYAGSVREVADNIYQHFEDISIVHADYELPNCPLNQLLGATAIETKDPKKTNRVYFRGKYYDVAPNLAGDFMKAVLTGRPYPRTLLSAVITRTKAEQSKKDPRTGKSIQNVSYPRASLIKAILCREARHRNSNGKEEVGMSLDISNTNPGYLLGRLFAVLEKVQIESAGGEGNINSTIRDRFYGSASSTPVVAFPSLMKLKNHHLAKLESFKGFYEKLIGEIVDKLSADKSFPSHLSLDDQGRFAVGYYHQRQDFFKKKDNN
ncbi:MAG: type I-C CRISPR-associated protein Cas8c/Csd1 [Thermodesulfobacteriota bacterium]